MEDFLGLEVEELVEFLESWGYTCYADPNNPTAILVPVTNCLGVRYLIRDNRAYAIECL